MRKPTNAQRRQRQLSWLLYVTEGAKRNLNHAGGMGEAMTDADHRVVWRTIDALDRATEQLRERMLTRPYTRRD